MKRLPLFLGLLLLAAAVPGSEPAKTPPGQTATLSYARDIKPILSTHCFACHGFDDENRKGRLRLDTFEAATRPRRGGYQVIAPGHPEKSELVTRILATDEAEVMPPPSTQHKLKDAEKELLKRWIAQGAHYEQHWAYVPPQRPPLPTPKTPGWARNPIDLFILERLEKEGLTPSPEADRYTLARRAALDLTGLPPTLDQVDRFINDPAPNAYEKYVDELLRSPAYGERWASVWLDLARYADSSGYAEDNARVIWRYRDWVIDAINKNMPFDQFTIEQIAGDLLPNPTEEQLIATAFHRNTPSNDEGGTDDEEFRVAAVVDRVNTTLQVWMGLTMACAQCHNHKYDPISQEEYFQVYAILNNTADSDKRDLSPVLIQYTPAENQQREQWQAEIDALQKQLKDRKEDKEKQAVQKQISDLQKKRNGIRGISTPIMRELPPERSRKTKIQLRGNFLNLGAEVQPGVPALFHPLPKGEPVNRLTLAKWLVDPHNPLTARVAVNRYWEQIFGKGLVETSEDFGMRGKLPTHPELLDWLALEFMTPTTDGPSHNSSPSPLAEEGRVRGWDTRRLLRLIVTSAAYRQSSRETPELLERDPGNLYYARGPRFRSSAELIRDQSLLVSGLLSLKMYGPPCRPPQPRFGVTAAFGGSTDWTTSTGDDKYRRGIYTQWRRSMPYPSMITFDAPNRNVCTVKRPRTNTPLQALTTMNDPVYVEAAQALARRMVKEGGATTEDKARHGFRLCLLRPPQEKELRTLVELFQKARSQYAAHPQEAQQMASDPLGPLPAGLDPVDMAAWTVVGNVLLNLDEMLMKR